MGRGNSTKERTLRNIAKTLIGLTFLVGLSATSSSHAEPSTADSNDEIASPQSGQDWWCYNTSSCVSGDFFVQSGNFWVDLDLSAGPEAYVTWSVATDAGNNTLCRGNFYVSEPPRTFPCNNPYNPDYVKLFVSANGSHTFHLGMHQ